MPSGVPIVLLVLLVPIELLSYFIRPFTLSIRLFANMLAGHAMLVDLRRLRRGARHIRHPAARHRRSLFMLLEVLVAALQAYVFAILTCLYLRDAIHLH